MNHETGGNYMFLILRKILIGLFLVCLMGAGYYIWSNPKYHRHIVQKAAEVKEKLKEGEKKFAWSGPGVVAEVVDGDTVVVNTETNPKVTMRLAGIDAPELAPPRLDKKLSFTNQPFAEEAKAYLSKLVKNQAVQIDIVAVDSLTRPVILLHLGDTNVNVKIVEAGLAELYEEYWDCLPVKIKNAIANAELQAKQDRLGIWGLANYQRPSEYRIRVKAAGK